VYAASEYEGKAYKVVAGFFLHHVLPQDRTPGKPAVHEDDDLNALLVRMDEKSCEIVTNMDFAFDWQTCTGCEEVPRDLVLALARDGILRAAKEFGGREEFMRNLRRDWGDDLGKNYDAVKEVLRDMGWWP